MNKLFIIFLFWLPFTIFPNDINYDTLSLIINNIHLDFSMFPTKNIWNGNEVSPILDTSQKRNYRTIITEASKLEPNFDGKYRIITFGYGSGAQYFFIIDLNNGNIYEGIPSTHGIRYNVNSSLIIINDSDVILNNWRGWDENIPNWISIDYVLWENNDFKLLLTINPFNN